MYLDSLTLLSGSANPRLAQEIANHLHIPLGRAIVETFSDGEISVEITDNVRGRDIVIIQSTAAPANDHLMELLLMVDAARRASASRITAVMPYMGYARQDRRPRSSRVPISAKVVADMIANVGTDRVLTVDLHADQIQGFFDLPLDNIYASPVLLGDIWRLDSADTVVVSPDIGGVVRARAIAKRLEGTGLAIIDKRRDKANVSEVMNIIGDVDDKVCVLVDDIVDTAGTLCNAARALKENGARQVMAYCTHPVLSGRAIENIEASELDLLVVTDTIALREEARQCSRIRQLSVAELLAESIRRIVEGESLSTMFVE